MSSANQMYDTQQQAFRLNLEFGLILVNSESGEYRYFTDFILRQRPNTKWKPGLVTNVRFTLYTLAYALGTVTIQLPDHVKNSKSIISLDKTSEGKLYKDNLCAFRCLATHKGHHKHRLESHSKVLFNKWVEYMQNKCPNTYVNSDAKSFRGVELSQMVILRNVLKLMSMCFVYRKNCLASLQITLSFPRHDALEFV